jgi:membrane protease YdiL (CAAX protease family)
MTTLTTATAPTTTTPTRHLGLLEAVLVPVGYLVLMIGAGVALLVAGWEPDGVGIALLTALVTFGAVGLTLALRVRSLAPLLLRAPGTRWLLTGLGIGVALRLLAFAIAAVWIALTGDAWNPHQDLADSAALGGWSFVAVLALGGLVIPFAEELLFRGVLYGPCAATGRCSPGSSARPCSGSPTCGRRWSSSPSSRAWCTPGCGSAPARSGPPWSPTR